MVNSFKINKYWVLTFCMVLFSVNLTFSQEISDAEIGLDVIQMTATLKERGLSDEAVNSEIIFARQKFKERYLEIKNMQESLVQKAEEEKLLALSLISDQEMGFDLARETNSLKEYGITDPEDLNREIDRIRERYTEQYIETKASEEEILQRIQPKRLLKAVSGIMDISQSEKEALKALYDSTNGSKWTTKTGWDFSTPVTSWVQQTSTGWYGIVIDNGHVISLTLPTNNLNGFIPPEIGQLKYLKVLNFGRNNFNGTTIPDEIGQLVNLEHLQLNSNKLSGPICEGIYNLKSVTFLQLFDNELTGSISPQVSKLTSVTNLYLYGNHLVGGIPSQIGQLPNLNSIDFSNNQLTGIPPEIGQAKNLVNLHITNNKLSGTIPSEMGSLKKLERISFGYNQLRGNIPAEIGTLPLKYVYFNNNLLEGALPNINVAFLLDLTDNKFRFTDITNRLTLYKAKTQYSPQATTDIAKTVTSGIGATTTLVMCEDGRFMPDDTYQWYKNGILISGAINRTYTITDSKAADAGVYTCKSFHNSNPDMSPLVLEREPITLNVINCTPLAGTIKSPVDKFYTNLESTFIFETTAKNLTYDWSVTSATGEIVNAISSNTTGLYPYKFTVEGDYITNVVVTDATGCITTFTRPVKVVDKHCAKEPVNFTFETATTGLNYTWISTNAANVIVHTITNNTGHYTFTPELPGEYVIQLSTDGTQNCETVFDKKINVEDCTPYISCTKTNNLTPEIHRIFITLINKLAGTPNGSDVNLYAQKEIAALSPYTTEKKAKIYNFVNTSTALSFSFSEALSASDVQIPKSTSGSINAVDLSNYENAISTITVVTKFSNGSNSANGYVRNIDFCPKELSCVSHVALVVDESGSIDATQANKIKKQLKAFVLQQAITNDNIGSNIYVSLTGMSDSDKNTRTDFIKPTKLTNTPASLNQFNSWIDALGKRNGKIIGISASSDYWRSGLEGSLSYSMKPNMVVMITDGCQTAKVDSLKTTMKKFNNAPGSNPELPHLYVVGLEKGFYVDENFYINAVSDPNNPGTLKNTVTTYLAKSLKYLFDFPDSEFPKSDSNELDMETYYGHVDFSLLATNNTYFSDKLINAGIICGTPSKKDFCDDCLSFKPEPDKEYILSAWVKEELFAQVKTYENPEIKIVFYNSKEALDKKGYTIDSLSVKASGNIIDGWQRVIQKFKIPIGTMTIGIKLENNSPSIPVYFDDIRIHPLQGSVKSFVYDPETFKLMSELDENNYGTFYEYDNEGGLVRVKKETEKGIKTIQETRSGSFINTN